MKKLMTLALAALCTLPTLAEGIVNYTMASPGSTIYAWGTQKRETYDVAIFLNNPQFVGQEVVGMAVPFNREATIEDYTAWMSTELKLENVDGKNVNAPDLGSVACNIDKNTGWLTATFEQPYTITDKGVYVGYSFTVEKLSNDYDRQPVAVVNEYNNGGFWLHTSRSYLSWEDKSEALTKTSAMIVYIKGAFAANYAEVVGISDLPCLIGDEPAAQVTLHNLGTEGISTLGYSYTCGDVKEELTYVLPKPITVYGETAQVSLPVPAQATSGSYQFTIDINSVNGETNEAPDHTATATYYSYSWEPEYLPLFEEFTGLWCGWCPAGYVGMKEMHRLYGDKFVCVSYHSDDLMTMKGGYPNYVDSFPAGCFDRTYFANPYGGFSEYWEWLLPEAYEQVLAAGKPTGEVDATMEWNDDASALTVNATARFIYNPGKTYRLAYLLLQNDLHNDSYYQANYFCKDEAYKTLPLLEDFADGYPQVAGLHYDDVAILASPWKGVENSLPEVKADEEYTHSYTFELKDAVNANSRDPQSLVQQKDKMSVIVYIVEENGSSYGRVVNSRLLDVPAPAGVEEISFTASPVISSHAIDLQGNPVDSSYRGVTIIINTHADGSRSYRKTINSFINQ